MRDTPDLDALARRAARLRRHVLTVAATGPAHVGGAMSAAELMAALFFQWLRLDGVAQPDHFILSKGHTVHILHACLVERGMIDAAELRTCGMPGSRLGGHPTRRAPGVEFATGSLGHGLSVGMGIALAEQLRRRDTRTVVLMGDGELQEGTVWEAALAAPRFGLEHLLAIVDNNRFQACGSVDAIIPLDPLADKWRAFRWNVHEIDGHDLGAILGALETVTAARGPSVIIAHTVKGKGVPSIEGTTAAHYAVLGDADIAQAIAGLGADT